MILSGFCATPKKWTRFGCFNALNKIYFKMIIKWISYLIISASWRKSDADVGSFRTLIATRAFLYVPS